MGQSACTVNVAFMSVRECDAADRQQVRSAGNLAHDSESNLRVEMLRRDPAEGCLGLWAVDLRNQDCRKMI